MSGTGQPYQFGFTDSLIAEVGGVPQSALHQDADAICRAYDAAVLVAERLGVEPPKPGLAGLAYNHVSTLGAEVVIHPDLPEPYVKPCIQTPRDIDRLREPHDYLGSALVARRLALARRLTQLRPDANGRIGHDYQGPITTAALLMGQDFFMLPYDDPDRAHRLIEFGVRSALNYSRALKRHQGRPIGPGPGGFCDDFAGMFGPAQFREFVLPYWTMMFEGLQATERHVHSELLREAHLPFLAEAGVAVFDPGVDQYLTPEILKRSSPVPHTLRIRPADVHAYSAEQLVAMYRHLAGFGPTTITFHLDRLADEAKMAALLAVARELA